MPNRIAQKQEYSALACLWQRVFKDSESFASMCLNNFAGQGQVLLSAGEGNIPQAMLLMVPCMYKSSPGVYLYALATQPALRRQGIMAGLMQFAQAVACARGAQFALLIPDGEGMFGYYKKQGYTKEIALRSLCLRQSSLQAVAPAMASYKRLVPAQLATLRGQYIPQPQLEFCENRMQIILSELYSCGAFSLQTAQGYAIAGVQNAQLMVYELGAQNTAAAQALLAAVAQKHRFSTVLLSLAQKSELFLGQETVEDTGQKESGKAGVACTPGMQGRKNVGQKESGKAAKKQLGHSPLALLKPLVQGFSARGMYFRFGLQEM